MDDADFYPLMLKWKTSLQNRLDLYRLMITSLTNGRLNHIDDIDIYKITIKNVPTSTLIIYYKAIYKSELTKLVFLTNLVNKTLTATHYERLKETFDDILQLQFELFGMATHTEWSAATTESFDISKMIYDWAINLQSQ
jgi:hypothetical protein